MKKGRSLLFLIALAGTLGGPACKSALPSRADGPVIDAGWVEEHAAVLRRIVGVPPEFKLELRERRDGPTPDYHELEFLLVREGGKPQRFMLYVSRDGRHVVYDRPYDLADPFGAIRKQISLEDVPSRGPEDAPLTIVEYSDYTCPYCRRFFLQLEKPMLERYQGRIRHVFKNFPLVGLRPFAQGAAVAGACAHRQGNDQFWKLRAQLFSHPEQLAQGRPQLVELAKGVGLDPEKFTSCLDSPEAAAEVERDFAEGERLNVDGTPTFFINGRPLSGLPTRDYFFHVIEEELEAAQAR